MEEADEAEDATEQSVSEAGQHGHQAGQHGDSQSSSCAYLPLATIMPGATPETQ